MLFVLSASAQNDSAANTLLNLRQQYDTATDTNTRRQLLQKIGDTGTFVGMMVAGNSLADPALAKTAAAVVARVALAHPEYDGINTRQLLCKSLPLLKGKQRKAVISHLASASDCEGYVSLFNGRDLTGWKGLVENPIARSKMTPVQLAEAQQKADDIMRRDWKVDDGLLVYVGHGYENICTTRQWGDFEMYVDWKLDPNGQEPDAGIYLRGTPQVQIWDIRRVNVGAQVGSGGLYNNQKNQDKPLCVADNPLGAWNSFFIRMKGDRVTVYLNGILVVDNVVLENYWDRSQPIFPIEQIELQAHGSRVWYRDIYVKSL